MKKFFCNHKFNAYFATLGLLLTTAVVLGANTDFSRYLSDDSSTAIVPNVSQKSTYPITFSTLNANIALNAVLFFIGSSFLFLLIDVKNKAFLNVVAFIFFLFWLGRLNIFI